MTMQRKILLLQTRNLGDGVIGTALLETLSYGLPSSQIDVLTRPEVRLIFENNPSVNKVYTGRFPMGSMRDFGMRETLHLLWLLRELRRERYTDVVNLVGDFREELLARIVSSGDNWSPAWSNDHPCSRINRRSAIRIATQPVPIDADHPNVYDAATIMGMAIGSTVGKKSALFNSQKKRIGWYPIDRSIGIHPMASQPWRTWPMEKWKEVAEHLVENGMEVHVFGSSTEAPHLLSVFGHLVGSGLKIQTGDISAFFAALSEMQMLLCHDSFAAHVAYSIGVPIIFLNGANDATAWAPPGAKVLAYGPSMNCYPCYNRPTCIGKSHEYNCVRQITVNSVLSAVHELSGNIPR